MNYPSPWQLSYMRKFIFSTAISSTNVTRNWETFEKQEIIKKQLRNYLEIIKKYRNNREIIKEIFEKNEKLSRNFPEISRKFPRNTPEQATIFTHC